jgi:hypothetical protein
MVPLPQYILKLTVVDSKTGNPIENADITLESDEYGEQTYSTPADGIINFLLYAGTYTLTAQHDAYITGTTTVTMIASNGYAVLRLNPKLDSSFTISDIVVSTDADPDGLTANGLEPYYDVGIPEMRKMNVHKFLGDAPATVGEITFSMDTAATVSIFGNALKPWSASSIFGIYGIDDNTCSFTTTPSEELSSKLTYRMIYNVTSKKFYVQAYDGATWRSFSYYSLQCSQGQHFYMVLDNNGRLGTGLKDVMSAIGGTLRADFQGATVGIDDTSPLLYAIVYTPSENLTSYTNIELGGFFYQAAPDTLQNALRVEGTDVVAMSPTSCTINGSAATVSGNHMLLVQPILGSPSSVVFNYSCVFPQSATASSAAVTKTVSYAALEEAYCYTYPETANYDITRIAACVLKPYSRFTAYDDRQEGNLSVSVFADVGTNLDSDPASYRYSGTSSESVYDYKSFYGFMIDGAGKHTSLPQGGYDVKFTLEDFDSTVYGFSSTDIYGRMIVSTSSGSFVPGEWIINRPNVKTGETMVCGYTFNVQ